MSVDNYGLIWVKGLILKNKEWQQIYVPLVIV